MTQDCVECSRCQETFATHDELVVHSIDAHTGEPVAAVRNEGERTSERGGSGVRQGDLDEQTVAQLRRVLETRSAGTGTMQALYGQRFIAGVAVVILLLALGLTGLHATRIVQTEVFTFALGTLFGLTLAYFHAFVQALIR